MTLPLENRIALVTGASRGIGLGIAHELGLAGATVYVTGRSRRGRPTVDDMPGTIDDSADLVTASGGTGIAVECDHTDPAAVEALAARIASEQERLDLLVHAAWGGYEQYDAAMFAKPVEDQPLWRWQRMMGTGVTAQYDTTRALAPLLLAAPRGLVVHISAGDGGKFLHDVQYDVAKAAVDRLGFAFARRWRAERATAVVIHPGFTRTERVLAAAPAEAIAFTHSPRYVGRAVVALAADPDVKRHGGLVFKVADLGRTYDFADIDGTRPEPFVIPDSLDG